MSSSSNAAVGVNQPKSEKIVVKVLVLGCANVGKTSLIERYVLGRFHGKRVPTVGADFLTKKLFIDNVEVTLQIWDTAGQERFHQSTLGTSFYRGAHGALLVYDVNNEKSFEQVSLWCDEALSKIDHGSYFPIVVVGNKVDLRVVSEVPIENEISTPDATSLIEWCSERSYGHVETSAKDNLGVEAAMTTMAALALEAHRLNQRTGVKTSQKEGVVKISEMYNVKKSSSCC